MADAEKDSGFLFVLKRIDKLNDKLEEHALKQTAQATKFGENIESLNTKVTDLTKLLTVDNGKPSIVSQVDTIRSSLESLKNDISSIRQHIGVKKQTSIEKWKTFGKLAALVSLVLPGILSFFGLAQ